MFVNLEAVYPNENTTSEEMSFEELRAQSRGWLSRDWAAESKQRTIQKSQTEEMRPKSSEVISQKGEAAQVLQDSQSTQDTQPGTETDNSPSVTLDNTVAVDIDRESRNGRPKKTKVREVKGETQTSILSHVLHIHKLIRCSQNEPRVSNRTETQAKEFRRANHDSPHQSCH